VSSSSDEVIADYYSANRKESCVKSALEKIGSADDFTHQLARLAERTRKHVLCGPFWPGDQQNHCAPILDALSPSGVLGPRRHGRGLVCQHEFLLRRFAIKILHSHLAQQADRMRFEAEATGRIRQPNVVEVVDSWLAPDGHPCIAMELLEGRSLWDELKDRVKFPVSEAIAITVQALSALSAAHALGVVHRDIKPENLFLHHPRNGDRTLKVLDFGIGRVLPNAPAEAPAPPDMRTATGTLVGSPRFMSPEGRRGEPVDFRADLFSLGVVLYLMLTGVTPDDVGVTAPETALPSCRRGYFE
jgi:serine/threonine protein kinase